MGENYSINLKSSVAYVYYVADYENLFQQMYATSININYEGYKTNNIAYVINFFHYLAYFLYTLIDHISFS